MSVSVSVSVSLSLSLSLCVYFFGSLCVPVLGLCEFFGTHKQASIKEDDTLLLQIGEIICACAVPFDTFVPCSLELHRR